MNDKPLAEQLRERGGIPLDEIGREQGYCAAMHDCATKLEFFAADHLTEQTEPDQSLLRDIEYMLTDSGYCPSVGTIAEMIRDVVNAERRRIRELLVGKETK